MSSPSLQMNGNVDATALKTEIQSLSKKKESISKDDKEPNISIFIDPEKRANEKRTEENRVLEENWINYIINMLERMAASAERMNRNLDGGDAGRDYIYDSPVLNAQATKEKENKKAKEKQEKEDKKLKTKNDEK
ncbi:MAG: hypothetical protein A2287_06995 [Candidatus Melainabacteria bacterium RIFOXYA12_FULL_32_12]|nr:MAG: hypothetical protein A2104_04995 [Candidatus Melainabacteria bacterium GWF2_32_7]OGI17255.1 MAG: hypothetical protein A2255_07615 [Candidatus Melainabacteria bacterium RIFOXYA2_FULL_32_9]OGI24219.1 MAG: hypothetical protein A2287_06995 [Candidatus Melainabacteria bacterium RIFOXYA12_FULL_32_12]